MSPLANFQITFFICGCKTNFMTPLFSTSVFMDEPQQGHIITTPSQKPITSINFTPHNGQDTFIFFPIILLSYFWHSSFCQLFGTKLKYKLSKILNFTHKIHVFSLKTSKLSVFSIIFTILKALSKIIQRVVVGFSRRFAFFITVIF